MNRAPSFKSPKWPQESEHRAKLAEALNAHAERLGRNRVEGEPVTIPSACAADLIWTLTKAALVVDP